ncbi:MAG: hypothetical protein AAFV53_19060, partial [Myxococcota bacterium]
DNVLEWVEISGGGDGDWANVYIRSTGGVAMRHVTSTNSATFGLVVESDAASLNDFSENTLTGNSQGAVETFLNQVVNLDNASTYSPNTEEGVFIINGSANTSGTWPAIDAPLIFNASLNIFEDIVVEAGAELVFEENARLNVEADSSLKAVGTEAAPIRLRGAEPTPGFWQGLVFISSSGNNVLEWVEISDGGDGNWSNVYIRRTGSATFQNTTSTNSSTCGVFVENNGFTTPTAGAGLCEEVRVSSNATADICLEENEIRCP